MESNFGVPKRCGDGPCSDLEDLQDLTARSVHARSWDLACPRRPCHRVWGPRAKGGGKRGCRESGAAPL